MVDGDNKLYAIRKDSSLIVGVSDGDNFIASDVPAILKYTNQYYLLDNDEYVVLDRDIVTIYHDGEAISK